MKRLTIVGVGALGSHVVQFLRNEPVQIKVIDYDRVESKNTQSQFCIKATVGKSKVEALKGTMNLLWGLKIEGIPHKLVKENTTQLLTADLLIDCLDNGPSRRLVQEFSRTTNTPCLHGAISADGSFGRAVWDPIFRIDEAPTEGAATCEDATMLPSIVTTAAFISRSAKEFLLTGKTNSYQVHPGGAHKL